MQIAAKGKVGGSEGSSPDVPDMPLRFTLPEELI